MFRTCEVFVDVLEALLVRISIRDFRNFFEMFLEFFRKSYDDLGTRSGGYPTSGGSQKPPGCTWLCFLLLGRLSATSSTSRDFFPKNMHLSRKILFGQIRFFFEKIGKEALSGY